MLFNSYEFIFVFLPFSFFLYFFLQERGYATLAKGFLVIASLFFYAWWNVSYLPILLFSMVFNYFIGNKLHHHTHRKSLLIVGIAANLLLLGYFKYADFFIENINLATHSTFSLLHLALPLAISFFTFQQIAYLVDSYRGETKSYDFLTYTLFVSFFPQLIAGPIVHHAEMMPQFASKENLQKNDRYIALGIFIFSLGLFKKVVIADSFALWATQGFDFTQHLSFWEGWATSLSYTFQLYFDFSGYTDMAIGAALLFNIKLPINFNSPYKALDIQDFWRRWHITLSRFLKDYIYIPLGGNRKGSVRTYANLLMTFILGGIWHGAGWTFVFWGFLHGLTLVIHRFWKKLGFNLPTLLAWFITFNFINIAWVFFRAKEWKDALKVLHSMTDISTMFKPFAPHITAFKSPILTYLPINVLYFTFASVVLGLVLTLMFKNSSEYAASFSSKERIPVKWSFFTMLLLGTALILTVVNTSSEFLYFNF